MNRLFALRTPLFENEDLGGAPSGGAPTPAPAPSPSPATPDHNAAAPATPNANAPAATPQVPNGYVPSYRIRETREAAMREATAQWQQREAAYQAQMDAIRRQLHAVIGVQPQSEEEQQVAQIQAQFKKVFPELAQLAEKAKDLQGLLERSGEFQHAVQHQYQAYGRQAMDRLFGLATKSLGHDLSDTAKQRLHASFVGYLQSDPQLLERYAVDQTIVDEFWNDFENGFIGPVRRAQSAGVQQAIENRPPTPRDTPAGIPNVQRPAKPKDLDESVSQAWAAFNAAKQGR